MSGSDRKLLSQITRQYKSCSFKSYNESDIHRQKLSLYSFYIRHCMLELNIVLPVRGQEFSDFIFDNYSMVNFKTFKFVTYVKNFFNSLYHKDFCWLLFCKISITILISYRFIFFFIVFCALILWNVRHYPVNLILIQ